MSVLFEPIQIHNMKIFNRFVRSATNDGGADEEGFVQDRQVELYEKLAAGGVGEGDFEVVDEVDLISAACVQRATNGDAGGDGVGRQTEAFGGFGGQLVLGLIERQRNVPNENCHCTRPASPAVLLRSRG